MDRKKETETQQQDASELERQFKKELEVKEAQYKNQITDMEQFVQRDVEKLLTLTLGKNAAESRCKKLTKQNEEL